MVYKRQRAAIQELAHILWQAEVETRSIKSGRILGLLEIEEPPRLFGVDDKLAELTAALATEPSPWLVAVVGIGGIGKTCLADAAVRALPVRPAYEDIATGSAQQDYPDAVYLAEPGSYAVLWEDDRSVDYDIYGQLVSPAGSLDGSNYLVAGETGNERFPRVTLDDSGGALVVWHRDNGGASKNDLYGHWLGSDGQATGDSFTILEADDDQQWPVVAGDGAGGYLLAWQDDRNGNWDIYASRFEPLRAGFTATPTVGIAPLRVEFADESSPAGVADEWLWAFGDGMTSTLASPVYTYTQAGVYTVTQWVTDTATGEWDVLTRTDYITVALGLVTTTIAYDYDPLYRLITATYSSGEVYTYTYDAVGNRLAMGADGELITYTYDIANRLTRVDDVEYTWDNNGNLLNNGVFSYMYDYANRLVSVEDMTTTVVYTYNGDGHRMAKAVDGVTTIYVVAVLGLSQVLVETTGGESVVYLYGHDLLAEEGGSGWAWHLGDGLGSVRQLADGDGEVTMAQGYTPFGVPLWDEGSGLTGYGFTGEQWEAYSQLLFLRARYYEPGTGSFLTRDPVTRNHPYQYAGANPIRFIDPAGLEYFPWADVYSCDHQGGPDLRDPYAYRLTWSDSVREVYLNAHRSPEEGGLGLRRPLIVGKDPGRAIAGGYDYRGIPCWVTNASGYGPPPPETRPRHRPWEWSISKQKTLLPLFNSFIGSCECTPFPKPVTLFVLEGFYEEGGKSAFEYWNSQQKGWDVRGTPFQETLVGDWYYEQGPEYRVYGPDSLMTRELMQHPCVWKAREEFCQAGCLDRYTKKCHDNLKEFPLSTIGRNVTDFGDCFLGWDTACANAVLGSRDVKIYNNGDGTATFTIRNVTGRQSATRSIFGKPGMPDKTRAQTRWDPNEQNWNPFGFDVTYVGITPGPRGWGGNLTQGYIWVEIMPCCQ